MDTAAKTKNQMSRECLWCGKVFYFHVSRKDTAKYCLRTCKDTAQNGQKAWNQGLTKEDYAKRPKKVLVLVNKCLNCGMPVKNKFCNHSCQKIYQNKQRKGKTYTEIYGEKKALEVQQKMSAGIAKTAAETHFTRRGAMIAGNQKRGKTYENFYGVDRANQIKEDIRSSLANFRQTPEGLEVRKRASDRGVYLALSGKEFTNTKKGYFEEIYFGSSLEKEFLCQVLRITGSLKNIERNRTKVISKGSGFKKTVPDYLVKDDSGKELAFVEVKGDHLLKRSSVYEKALALYVHGREHNILTGYFTYNTLKVFKKLQGNPEPRRLNSLLSYTALELYNYVVSRKVQRLSVEDEETNKTLKNVTLGSDIPNDPLPYIEMEGEIVRYPMKVGECI